MSFLVKKYAIRAVYAIINPVRIVYNFIVRPETRGVRCIIEHDGKYLFVKLGYGPKHWTIPGGKVDSGESDIDAILRETFEEVGIKLNEVEKIGEYKNGFEYKRDTVSVFYSKIYQPDFVIDPIEIDKARWATFEHDFDQPSKRLAIFKEILVNHNHGKI